MKPYCILKHTDLGSYCPCCATKYQKKSKKLRGGKKRARQSGKKTIRKELKAIK